MICKLCGICDGKLKDKIERKQPQTVKYCTQNRVKKKSKIMKDCTTQPVCFTYAKLASSGFESLLEHSTWLSFPVQEIDPGMQGQSTIYMGKDWLHASWSLCPTP